MKKIIISLLVLLISGNVFSEGIKFEHGTLNEAFAKAKQENKLIFIDCYTTWCGPCKYLSKKVFTNDEVGDFFNARFINMKMDMESDAGKLISGKYQVKSFPTLLWLDFEGNVQHRVVGASDNKSLIKAAQIALDENNNFNSMNERFKNGDRTSDFLKKYIIDSEGVGVYSKEAVDYYFASKKLEELTNKSDLMIINNTIKSTSHPIYRYILTNRKDFYAVSTQAEIDSYLLNTMSEELVFLAEKGDKEALSAKGNQLKKLDQELGTQALALMELKLLQKGSNQKVFYQALVDYAFKFTYDKSDELNSYAWMIAIAKVDLGNKLLNNAVKMVERSIELDINYMNLDTYACVLYKAGKVEEAKIEAAKSVKLAPDRAKKGLWSTKFLDGGVK
ncbi:thioredoxin [Ancylomarina euxinus]|uniref:Thioredoxin n=1 Tax=Ancylomarina euxinus TaxID=2283627 RepID=A0A425XZB1_9BACT|nr:thioredoxin family protein [Ancylomarina euxinus]MCZ4695576.1 thioredoxin family protein [Ancylomarina euxinus]MUP15957.1 DUF255 domain-containing protein [Ancylomarina euxinus]RRG20398.1 thioredoxin [Ancylomarina euxinus]